MCAFCLSHIPECDQFVSASQCSAAASLHRPQRAHFSIKQPLQLVLCHVNSGFQVGALEIKIETRFGFWLIALVVQLCEIRMIEGFVHCNSVVRIEHEHA